MGELSSRNRRRGLLGSALVVVGLAAAAWSGVGSAKADDVTLTYASYGGALQKAEEPAWLEPFAKANAGIKVAYDITDYAKLKAMVESGNVVWDVVTVANDFGLDADKALLEPIDCSLVPCADLQPTRFLTTGYRAAQTTAGLAIGYNKTKMPAGKVPQGWVDFFDTKTFPGKRVIMMDASSYPFEQALLGDGVAPDKLYPLDLDRAIKKLNSLGKDLVLAPSYQGCAELIGAGEAVMGGCWTGRLLDVKERGGAPVEVQWNQGIIAPGYYVVPKGAPHKDLAMKLIAYIVSAEHNAALSNYIGYGPTNIKALANVKPDVAPRLQSSYLDKSVFVNDVWYDTNRAAVNKRWAEWTAGLN